MLDTAHGPTARTHRRPRGTTLAALGSLALLAALPACEEQPTAPAPATANNTDPSPDPAPPTDTAARTPAGNAPEGVEEIQQGAEGELAEGTNNARSGLATLPGFVPSASPTSEAGLRHTPALPVTAATPDDAPVLVHITVIDVTEGDDESLAPLADYLAGSDASSMDTDEVEGLYELLGALRESGVVTMLGDMRALVLGGQPASITVKNAIPSDIPGVDAARDEMTIDFAPSLTDPVGEGPDAERFVRLAVDFRMSREDSPWKILANDLGLDIGPRTRVAGTTVVRSGETFFLVRRIAGEQADREVLVLVRPQVMPQEFNK
ncbi:MAG: hypothetical protein DHS20C14_08010 [Phycisphaeraceae bacterium]|nr:MAG: hypothetical protein DHS20C14_08010 [Phycisphaeraceae bacterium]